MSQSISCILLSLSAFSASSAVIFFSNLGQCSQIRLQDSTLWLGIEHMRLKVPTENVEEPLIAS